MRDLLISAIILGSLPISFKRPFIGLLMFSILAYMRLQDLSWGFAKFERWSLYVALVMVAGYISQRERALPVFEPRTVLMILLALYIGVGQAFAVGPLPVEPAKYVEYVKIIFIAIFTTAVVRTKEHLRILMWVIGMSFAFYGLKNGLAGIIRLGNLYIMRGPGGMLEDNNDFALAMAMSVPVLIHLATSEKNPLFKKWLNVMAPLSGVTVILTRSRGGTLSLGLATMILVWRSRNRFLGAMIGACAVLAVAALAPTEWRERISTIKTYEEDGSAMGRIHAWRVAGRMIKEHPVTGVGFDRFAMNHAAFETDPIRRAILEENPLVAHNSYLQIWAECGTPAFAMYLALVALSFLDIWRVRREAKRRYNASWILSYCTMFETALATFMLGSMFLNRAHFDLVYHYVAIVLVFGRVAREQMARDDAGLGGAFKGNGRRGGLALEPARGFARRTSVPAGFRTTKLSETRS